METRDQAMSGTAATPELWGAVYMMLAFAVLSRALRAWQQWSGHPFGWELLVNVGLDLLICPAPLLMGYAFRKLVTRELGKNHLSSRTYRICNYRIAQMLVVSYIAMVL
jgi:hypothetical protein